MAQGFFFFLGKIMFISLFLFNGQEMYQNPQKQSKKIAENYNKVSTFTGKHFRKLDNYVEFLGDNIQYYIEKSDKYVQKNPVTFTKYSGLFLILSSILVLVNIPYASILISIYIIASSFLLTYPTYSKGIKIQNVAFPDQFEQYAMNIAFLGISLMLLNEQELQQPQQSNDNQKKKLE